jgi:Fe-S cluster assembly protein SufD
VAEQMMDTFAGRALSEKLGEPGWLSDLREEAFQFFQSAEIPWLEKTDLRRRGFDWLDGPEAAVHEAAKALYDQLNGPKALVIDGVLQFVDVPAELLEAGVIFGDLHALASKYEKTVRKYLFSAVSHTESKWAAMNAAAFHGGVFLYVPKYVVLDRPVIIIRAQTSVRAGAYSRTLVVGDIQSSGAVTEVFFRAPASPSTEAAASVVEVIAEADAHWTVGIVDEILDGPAYFHERRAVVGKDANVDWVLASTGDGFVWSSLQTVLDGAGGRSTMRVLGTSTGRMHHDLTAKMVHRGRSTESDIVMHGVLRGRSNAIFRSCTEIVKGAVDAGSEQHDRMIVLDGSARADAIPMLLIDENDVKRCGHAASVGKIDPIQVYYLMSRGIPETQALKMIIWGYLEQTVAEMPAPEALRDLLVGRIEKGLVG